MPIRRPGREERLPFIHSWYIQRTMSTLGYIKNISRLPGTERAISIRVAHRMERENEWACVPRLGVRYEHIACTPVIRKRIRCRGELVGVSSVSTIPHYCCCSPLN